MLFNIDENTVISVLCDFSSGLAVETLKDYLSTQTFKNYELVIISEGYDATKAGQSKNELLWNMGGNLFVFASAIDTSDKHFISNLVERFLFNRKVGLIVGIDRDLVPESYALKPLSKSLMLEFIERSLMGSESFTSNAFTIVAGYKSVTKPAGWYKSSLTSYEDFNLVYRTLTKNDVNIAINATQINTGATNKKELVVCLEKALFVEDDELLSRKCKRLITLAKKLRGVHGS